VTLPERTEFHEDFLMPAPPVPPVPPMPPMPGGGAGPGTIE
jgi:hypothetical protein